LTVVRYDALVRLEFFIQAHITGAVQGAGKIHAFGIRAISRNRIATTTARHLGQQYT